jgi:anti-sigma factor RsiW
LICEEAHRLIHLYLDGELDLVRSLEIEAHLNDCQSCAQAYNEFRSLHSAVSNTALRFEPPAALRNRVRAALRDEIPDESGATNRPLRLSWRWMIPAVSFAVLVIVALSLLALLRRPSTSDLVAQEIVSSHVRSLMEKHLTDVPSSDQHTVKPWFDGRLDFSPPVKDLASAGFGLVGGRLDYIGNRPVAALVYQHRQHYINVFVWPSTGASDASGRALVRQGYNLINWTNSGMNYWAISDLNLADLQRFVQLLQNDFAILEHLNGKTVDWMEKVSDEQYQT